MSTPGVTVNPSATARDVEVVCCTDCCARLTRTARPGAPSPSTITVTRKDSELVMTGAAKAAKVALPTIQESK